MPADSAPVVVMRWFRDGGGYAYDARVDTPTLTAVIGALGEVFARPPGSPFRLTLADGRQLLGDRQPDDACLDERAVGRQPTITRAVLLDRAAGPRLEARLRRQLAGLPLPTAPGPQAGGLSLTLPPPIRVPEPAVPLAAVLLRRVPWAAAALWLLLEGALYATPPLAGPPLAALCRVAVVILAAGLAWRLVPPVASRDELNRLEEAWAGESGDESTFPPPGLFDDQAEVLLPNGRLIAAAKLTSAGGWLRPRGAPTSVSDPEYTAARCHLGLAVVRGYERLLADDGSEARCAFVRHYAPAGRHWRLVFVQWTPAPTPLLPANEATTA